MSPLPRNHRELDDRGGVGGHEPTNADLMRAIESLRDEQRSMREQITKLGTHIVSPDAPEEGVLMRLHTLEQSRDRAASVAKTAFWMALPALLVTLAIGIKTLLFKDMPTPPHIGGKP